MSMESHPPETEEERVKRWVREEIVNATIQRT